MRRKELVRRKLVKSKYQNQLIEKCPYVQKFIEFLEAKSQ